MSNIGGSYEKKGDQNAGITLSEIDSHADGESILLSQNGKLVKAGDRDEAMLLLLQHQDHSIELDLEKDRKLLWKIDWYLMPIMCLLYCFQYMDKVSNSYASILGLRSDLEMKGDMFSWSGSAFYLGYLFFEYPAVRILQKFPVAKAVGIFVVLWGIVLCLHSVPNYAGFITLRTILGMLESSITPAFVIITGQYYRKEETFLRTALWFSSNGIGTIIGSGAIAYNILEDEKNYSLAAWKLVFIITGALTIFLGIIILVHLPDSPANAWFLNEEEKLLVVARIRANQQGFGNKHFKWNQFKEAFLDIKTWLFFFTAITGNIPNGGLTNFSSILLTSDLGFSTKKALLMQIPNGAIEFVVCSLFAYFSKYVKSRMFWAILALWISVLGQLLLSFASNNKVQLAGYWIQAVGPVSFICILSSVASNVAGHTKKTTVNAILLIGYCVGNLIGPQTFLASEAPHYSTAKTCIAVFSLLSAVILILIFVTYWFENRLKDKRENDLEKEKFGEIQHIEFADLTDKQNPYFRYSF
ncbi:allantoate permease [Suhomyces tanzawaensis NRRL Y-17324]|uniref:Allantoate permease n=1 Tax=Suhomyces tanzawaensis NRRL Y-17324 TaxID=984487 RepID=A0A1E4SLN5_9ASCO|nr:allantoate permease [Suhomyces tanzawaensis NRRL Y-17324]ODV80434.1 allantoate permease [Suhomyces tanzawaensis NRRL Y-17324]